MISLEKWMILTPLQKLPDNVVNLGKIIVATSFEWLTKVQKIAQSGHTAPVAPKVGMCLWRTPLQSLSCLNFFTLVQLWLLFICQVFNRSLQTLTCYFSHQNASIYWGETAHKVFPSSSTDLLCNFNLDTVTLVVSALTQTLIKIDWYFFNNDNSFEGNTTYLRSPQCRIRINQTRSLFAMTLPA